ncbi:hypothetical protein Tco_1202799 [Tanacetum coccineum]
MSQLLQVHSLMVLQVQKKVIMQVKLEWRQNLSKITFCYYYGLHDSKAIFPQIQRDSPDDDPNLTSEYCKESLKKIPRKDSEMKDQEKEIMFKPATNTQKKDGIFISQDKYVVEILKKFRFTEVKTASTLMETQKPLLKDEDGKEVDVHMYRSMIGSLMYLTSSIPDIMFAVCACARYQVNLKVSHLHAIKRSFRKPKRKDTQVPQSSDPMENVTDEAVYKELGDILVRAATIASSLEAKQDSSNINKTQSKATPNEFGSQGTNSGGGTRCQETMGDTIAQTRFENASKHSNDSLLARGNTLRSDEDRLKIDELMALCITLQNRVLNLEKTKTTQDNEIASLKRRVKNLEKKSRPRTHKLKRLYKVGLTARVESSDDKESLGEDASKQGRIDDIDADEEITLVSVHDVNVSAGEEEVVEVINTAKLIIDAAKVSAAGDKVSTASVATIVSAATTTTATTVDDITLAQVLEEMKSTKPKKKGVVIQELGESTTTKSTPTISSQQSLDKGKGILIEPVEPIKKKDLIRLDEEDALKLQVEFDEEERLAREKAEKEKEANIALIETWDDIQAKIDADHQLAERMQAQEQEELSIKEKATLFQQLLEKRRKHFAAKRAEEKRNKPPTKAQQRKIMCTYLKNMEGYKLNDLKLKDFDYIQEMFDRAFKRVNTFEDFRTKLVEGKEKRAGTELIQENTKKQKVDDDKETTELKQYPRDVKIACLNQWIQELEFPQLQQDSLTEEAKTKSNVWDDGSEDINPFARGNPGFHDDHYDNPLLTKETESKPIIWDIRDEEEEYPFVNKYPSFQEEPIVLVEEESCPIYDTDNEEEESMPVYDTDIEDIIEEEEGFVGKG